MRQSEPDETLNELNTIFFYNVRQKNTIFIQYPNAGVNNVSHHRPSTHMVVNEDSSPHALC